MVRLTSSPFLHPLSMNHQVSQHPLETPRSASDARDLDRSTRSHDDEESTVLAGNTSKKNDERHGDDHGSRAGTTPDDPGASARHLHHQQHHAGTDGSLHHASPLVEKHRKLSQLPRSVRWRLSLGLLTDPSEDDKHSTNEDTADADPIPNNNDSNNNNDSSSNNNNKSYNSLPPKCTQQILQQQKQHQKSHADISQQLKSIEEVNALKIRFQRTRYDDLEKKHYWAHTPVGIAGGAKDYSHASPAAPASTVPLASSSLHHVPKGDDPLSALLDQEEKGSLFGFGGKRRSKRSGMGSNSRNDVKTAADGGGEVHSGGNPSVNHSHQAEEEEGKGASCVTGASSSASSSSRWADFYSTREMLDVIEKDLNRLPSDHYTVYHSWKKRCKGWEEERREEEEKKKKKNGAVATEEGVRHSIAGIDESFVSLQSMQAQHHHHYLQQQQQQQQQQQLQQQQKLPFVRRKRFTHTGLTQLGRDRTTFTKLSSTEEEDEIDHTKKAEAAEKIEIETSTKERAEKLSQILFVYAQEHEEIGYRQGMHEILSYILLVLEMDLMEHAVVMERKRWRTDVLSSLGMPSEYEGERDCSGMDGGVAGVDSSGNIVVVHLLDSDYILHDAFTLFECVMDALASAYDITPAGEEETSAGCLEAMTSSIVSKIRYVARDEALFSHVLYMPVPPQLYFAKWVRLMFGREVAGGMNDVMRLWDAFFELASATASMEDDLSISKALMNVLKTAAASMILLIRHLLLAPTVAWDGSLTGDPDPNEGIAFLMNYPPIEDIGVLVKTITTLLAKEKILAAQSSHHQESHHAVHTGRRHPLASSAPIVTLDNDTDQSDVGIASRASSYGDFMGWPSSEPENNNENPPSRDDLGEVIAENDDSVEGDINSSKFDVSEAFGNFANGLFGLGTRTVDAAISAIQKQPQAPPPHDLEKPLFTGVKRFMDNSDANQSTENSPDEETPHDENSSPSILPETFDNKEDPTLIAVTTAALNDGNKRGKVPRRRNSLSADSTENDEWCAASIADSNVDDNASATSSSYSKMSVSRSLAETIRKDPKDLAAKLEKSVATLMKHFHDQMRARADTSPTCNGISDQTMMIPGAIWDAMADIDQVRKDLLSQSATEQLDKSPSYMSLVGLDKKVEDVRQSSMAKKAEEAVLRKVTRRNSLFW